MQHIVTTLDTLEPVDSMHIREQGKKTRVRRQVFGRCCSSCSCNLLILQEK